jgi:hypothetical protein
VFDTTSSTTPTVLAISAAREQWAALALLNLRQVGYA